MANAPRDENQVPAILGTSGTSAVPIAVDASGNLQVDILTFATAVDTELPAAAALADNTANPTAPAVAAFPHLWDGATWDRAPGDSANGMDVDITRNPTSATATHTSVADTGTSTTLKASNASRKGLSITNDSSARLYIKLGATASATDYWLSLSQHGYCEVPFGYTGIVDGIWASDPGDGAARVVEFT